MYCSVLCVSLYLYIMKYLITESQLNKAIFRYFDNQDFIQIENEDNIYFANSEGDEYAKIKYYKDDGRCYIFKELINDISLFFSMKESDSRQAIGRWVENIIQMEVTLTFNQMSTPYPMLRIPD